MMKKIIIMILIICFPAISSAETTVSAKTEKASNANIDKAIEKEALKKMRKFAYIIKEVGKSYTCEDCKSQEEKERLIDEADELFLDGMDRHFMTITSKRHPNGYKRAMRSYLESLLRQSLSRTSMPIYEIQSIKINTRDKRFVRKHPGGSTEYVATAKYTQKYVCFRTGYVERARQSATAEEDVKTMEIHIFVTRTKDGLPGVLLGDVIASKFTPLKLK